MAIWLFFDYNTMIILFRSVDVFDVRKRLSVDVFGSMRLSVIFGNWGKLQKMDGWR